MDKIDKIFFTIMAIAILIAVGVIGQMVLSIENKTIIGEVTDTVFYDDYMAVTFDNGEVYNINYNGNGFDSIDLTVNSRMRVELHYANPFIYPNVNDVWIVINIVKVPDIVEGD